MVTVQRPLWFSVTVPAPLVTSFATAGLDVSQCLSTELDVFWRCYLDCTCPDGSVCYWGGVRLLSVPGPGLRFLLAVAAPALEPGSSETARTLSDDLRQALQQQFRWLLRLSGQRVSDEVLGLLQIVSEPEAVNH